MKPDTTPTTCVYYAPSSHLRNTAIEGLMLLGRTRQEAIQELHAAEDQQDKRFLDAWHQHGDFK
jgi:hypothetical protein